MSEVVPDADLIARMRGVYVITGSSANCGKSYFAQKLGAFLNATILSNDKIRIPIHGNKRPDIKHWDEASQEQRQSWCTDFDSAEGGSCVDEDGLIMTAESLAKRGGPWKYSSRATSEYILHFVTSHPDEIIIIEGQFQLAIGKEENLELLTELKKIGAFLVYIDTPMDICKERHALSGKSYDVALVEKYASGNLSLAEWFKKVEWRKNLSLEQASVLGCHNQIVLSGHMSVEQNIASLCAKCAPLSSGPPPTLCFYPTAITGELASACLCQDVKDMNLSREEIEKDKAWAEQADPQKVTEHCWSFENKPAPLSITNAIDELYKQRNPLILGCNIPIDDFPALVGISSSPPMYITLQERPPPHVIIDMVERQQDCNCYDIPCLVMINGHVLSAIPNVYEPFKAMIEMAFQFFLSVKKRVGDQEDLIILVSSQTVLVESGKAGSLVGLHYDNVRTPADDCISTDVKTKQYPTILMTLEVEKNKDTGEVTYIENTSDTENDSATMGTVVYSHTKGFNEADIMRAAKTVNLKEQFAPLEGVGLMLKFTPNTINVHKGENGVLSIFSHLHKAVVNASPFARTRSQWRFMVVQRKNFDVKGQAFLGYDKQSENTTLSQLLREHGYDPLDSHVKSNCKRYQHRDPHNFDTPKTYPNPQTHVQTRGLTKALERGGGVNTQFPRIISQILNNNDVGVSRDSFSSAANLRTCSREM